MPVSRALRADSSRTSRVAAGWPNAGRCDGVYVKKTKDATYPRRFSWLQPRLLLESRNHVLADLVRRANTDIVNDERMRWVAAQRAAGIDTDFVIDRTDLGKSFSFLAVGDPGEADSSQYVVVPHLLEQEDTDFALIVSDVIYPTGENNDYPDGFYRPYQEYGQPIYALPGNHDWYSLLTGFMWNFCGVEPLVPTTERLSSYSWQERLARFIWLRPRKPVRELLLAYREKRWRIGRRNGETAPHQDGPYFAIQTPSVLIVCIDTGTSGTLDREQGEWLLKMAQRPGRKLLFTGRPIWVNGDYHECEIKWLPDFTTDKHPERSADPAPRESHDEPGPPKYKTVDDVVQEGKFGFIAAIGGDVHNYQRYPGPGPVQYVVSGGGGAFMSPTHTIDDLDRIKRKHPDRTGLVPEAGLRLYPLRGDSMARFAQGAPGRLRRLLLYVGLLSLVLWFLTLQVWNPRDAGVFQWANVSPEWTVWVVSPLSWLPSDADYDRWAAVVVGGLALAAGVGLLLLPWFDWRVKGALAVVATGSALLAWHGALLELPAGDHSYLAGVVGAAAVVILATSWARDIHGWYRVGIALGLFVVAAVMADWTPVDSNWWGVGREVAVLAGVSILLVGGPRLGWAARGVAAGAILALTGFLFVLQVGWSGLLLFVIAGLVTLFFVYAFLLLAPVVLARREVDPDQAARSLARTKAVRSNEPPKPGLTTRWKLFALRRRLYSRFLYPAETMYSALFDYNDQPFFKSFLRVDVDDEEVKMYCFGVGEETIPATVEDHVRWDGRRWTEARAILGAGAAIVVGEVDWFEGPRLVFHLGEEAVGRRFTILFAGDDEWRPVDEFEYQPGGELRLPEDSGRPRRIALEHGGELYAEGVFV